VADVQTKEISQEIYNTQEDFLIQNENKIEDIMKSGKLSQRRMTIPGLDLKTVNPNQASITTTKILINSPAGSESKMS
jgi:hypothetical protein